MLLALAVAQTTRHATIWATVATAVDAVVHRLLLFTSHTTPVGALLDVDVHGGFAARDASSSRRDVSCVTGVDDDADDDERQTENGDGERRLLHGC